MLGWIVIFTLLFKLSSCVENKWIPGPCWPSWRWSSWQIPGDKYKQRPGVWWPHWADHTQGRMVWRCRERSWGTGWQRCRVSPCASKFSKSDDCQYTNVKLLVQYNVSIHCCEICCQYQIDWWKELKRQTHTHYYALYPESDERSQWSKTVEYVGLGIGNMTFGIIICDMAMPT